MKRETIIKTIGISATREKIWTVLLSDEYYGQWTAEFSSESNVETDWQTGSKAVFTDNSGSGIFGTITNHIPNEVVSIQYDGILLNGEEDTESAEAKRWIGGMETYRLTKHDQVTELCIETEVPESVAEEFSEMWDRALAKVKALSEN